MKIKHLSGLFFVWGSFISNPVMSQSFCFKQWIIPGDTIESCNVNCSTGTPPAPAEPQQKSAVRMVEGKKRTIFAVLNL